MINTFDEQVLNENRDNFSLLCLIMIPGFMSWSFFYFYFFNASVSSLLCLISSLIVLVLYFVAKKKFSKLLIQLVFLVVWLNFVVTGTFAGGYSAAGMQHLVLFPFGAFLLTDFRSGLFWTMMSFIGLTYFYCLYLFNIPVPVNFTIGEWVLMYKLCLLSITGIASVATILLNNDQNRQDEEFVKIFAENIDLEKKSQLGQMAGQVAHEINNPLAIINGHLITLKRKILQFDPDAHNFISQIEDIEKSGARIEKIVRSLRYLSRNPAEDYPVECTLGDIVNESLVIGQERMRKNGILFELVDEFNLSACKLTIKRVIVSQVLVALIDNSFDAVLQNNQKWIKVVLKDNGANFLIQVQDSGEGVAEEHIRHLFLPLFTTKTHEHHVGMALSRAKELLETMQSDLTFVGNHPTTFEIRLPK
ncbi:MAG: hypothetical protein Fur0010_27480 [Bdellovibrio sp.]